MTTAHVTALPFTSPGGFVTVGANGLLELKKTETVEGKEQEMICSASGPLLDHTKRKFAYQYPSGWGGLSFAELPSYNDILPAIIDGSGERATRLEIGMDVAAKMYAQGILTPQDFANAMYDGNSADLGVIQTFNYPWLQSGLQIVVTDELRVIRAS